MGQPRRYPPSGQPPLAVEPPAGTGVSVEPRQSPSRSRRSADLARLPSVCRTRSMVPPLAPPPSTGAGPPQLLGPPLAWRKPGCRRPLDRPSGKCLPHLSSPLEPSPRALRLPQHLGCTDGGQPGSHSGHRSPPYGTYAGVGPPPPTSSHHTQPAFPYGAAVGRAMGPRSHRGPPARDRALHSETNQGGPGPHRQNHLRYHHCLLAGLHYNGTRTLPKPGRPTTPSTFGGRANEHSRLGSSPRRGSRLSTEFPTPCFVGLPIELATQHSGVGGCSVRHRWIRRASLILSVMLYLL